MVFCVFSRQLTHFRISAFWPCNWTLLRQLQSNRLEGYELLRPSKSSKKVLSVLVSPPNNRWGSHESDYTRSLIWYTFWSATENARSNKSYMFVKLPRVSKRHFVVFGKNFSSDMRHRLANFSCFFRVFFLLIIAEIFYPFDRLFFTSWGYCSELSDNMKDSFLVTLRNSASHLLHFRRWGSRWVKRWILAFNW